MACRRTGFRPGCTPEQRCGGCHARDATSAVSGQDTAGDRHGPGHGDRHMGALRRPCVGATSHFDHLTIAYNAATGAQLWARRYNGAANTLNTAKSLAVSPDGKTVYVTGYSGLRTGSSFNADYVTIAYNATTGAQRWL